MLRGHYDLFKSTGGYFKSNEEPYDRPHIQDFRTEKDHNRRGRLLPQQENCHNKKRNVEHIGQVCLHFKYFSMCEKMTGFSDQVLTVEESVFPESENGRPHKSELPTPARGPERQPR
jgi:hypothetical protein